MGDLFFILISFPPFQASEWNTTDQLNLFRLICSSYLSDMTSEAAGVPLPWVRYSQSLLFCLSKVKLSFDLIQSLGDMLS